MVRNYLPEKTDPAGLFLTPRRVKPLPGMGNVGSRSVTGCMLRTMPVRCIKAATEGGERRNLQYWRVITSVKYRCGKAPSAPFSTRWWRRSRANRPLCRPDHFRVTDRPGHDLRYAIDAAKIQRDLA